MNTRQILVAFSSYCDDEGPIAINHIHIRKTTLLKPKELIQEFLVPIKGITTLENPCTFHIIHRTAVKKFIPVPKVSSHENKGCIICLISISKQSTFLKGRKYFAEQTSFIVSGKMMDGKRRTDQIIRTGGYSLAVIAYDISNILTCCKPPSRDFQHVFRNVQQGHMRIGEFLQYK
jgi:hypothetical protein